MEYLNASDFIVTNPVKLDDIPTRLETGKSKKEKKKSLKKIAKELSKLQDTMYAHNRYGVLVCLQGMDTSGKDSLIREVFSKFNPRGVVVHSFKTPTKRELQHDNLWRHYVALPEKGKYSIFNRSHYENVLVTQVNPQFLFFENIPGIKKEEDIPADFWDKRFNQIRNFEEHITQNGIIVFKFFLHLSKEEQRLRLLRRLEREDKHWKFSPGDLSERELWDKYLNYYEEAINKTALPYAPWYIIPADNKHTARYLVVKIIHEKNITPDFFDLKSGIAGEILQKFSTYLVRLAIVGDFVKYTSNSLNDFIFESNKGRHISFVSSCAEAIKILSNK